MAELIVAFDLPSGREALALAARLPGLRWAKIGPVLYTREGPAVVREFVARGLRGVVASGRGLGLLRAALGPELLIVVPGIREPGDATADQRRTVTPADAVRLGATHLVVGRHLTRAANPTAVYQRLVESM